MTAPVMMPSGAPIWKMLRTVALRLAENDAPSSADAAGPKPAWPTPMPIRAASSVGEPGENAHAAVAPLHAMPMTAMARTRLQRSTRSATGSAPRATTTDTAETNPPNWSSLTANSARR
jgi:hypothetical protein